MAKEKQNLQERMVKIIDAVVKEDEGTEEVPVVKKTLWLVLQDVETQAIFQSPLSLDDIKEITGMSRTLQGRELYNFATNLRARVDPIKLIVDFFYFLHHPKQIFPNVIFEIKLQIVFIINLFLFLSLKYKRCIK